MRASKNSVSPTPPESIASEETTATRLRAVDPENAVTRARLRLGLTQEAFAQLLDTPVGTIRGWEQGRRQPPPCAKLLMRVAMEHPGSVLSCSTAEVNTPTPKQARKTAKTAKPVPSQKPSAQVAAQLHQSGEEADFWLL